jgi:hypothetical protein
VLVMTSFCSAAPSAFCPLRRSNSARTAFVNRSVFCGAAASSLSAAARSFYCLRRQDVRRQRNLTRSQRKPTLNAEPSQEWRRHGAMAL